MKQRTKVMHKEEILLNKYKDYISTGEKMPEPKYTEEPTHGRQNIR